MSPSLAHYCDSDFSTQTISLFLRFAESFPTLLKTARVCSVGKCSQKSARAENACLSFGGVSEVL